MYWGGTPLDIAIARGEKSKSIALMLIGNGADINAPDAEGKSPLQKATPQFKEAMIKASQKKNQ